VNYDRASASCYLWRTNPLKPRRSLLGDQSHTFGRRKPFFWRMSLRRRGDKIGVLGSPRYERSERGHT
jgi:hypothetical protein